MDRHPATKFASAKLVAAATVAFLALACSKAEVREDVQPSPAAPKQDPVVVEAQAFVAAMRTYYPVARQAEITFNEGERCAQGTKWERDASGTLKYNDAWDKCTTACENRQACLDKCYVKAGGKGTVKEREECWATMPAAMTQLKGTMMVAANGCPADARKAVADALDDAGRHTMDATGFMKPFPWGIVHDGLEPCASKLFRCGKLTKEPCKGHAIANFFGLRGRDMPSEATFQKAASERSRNLFLANGSPANL